MDTVESKIRSLLKPEVLALSAYHVQDASGYIKLDAMENPYDWPESMVGEWLARLRQAKPNRYPDPEAGRLKSILKAANHVLDPAGMILGNGSDELIQIILMALGGRNATVLAPEPTFVMYRQIAVSLGLRFVGVSLCAADFSLDMDAMRAAIREHQPAVIFLAYPNNPTGNAFATDDVLEVLRLAPNLVVIDEAYAPFADHSFMNRLPEFDRLLVMRTLSKLGLAGLRLGFLAGHPAWIEQLDKLRLPYNINILTQISAEFALLKHEVFDAQVTRIRQDRERLTTALQSLPGVQVYPSQANFLTFRLSNGGAQEVFDGLRQAGILIKNLHPAGGLLRECLRVTVGTPSENQRFIAALRGILRT
jgi:histidinol-phosphate aminotransferase